jgi:hypothetical protein
MNIEVIERFVEKKVSQPVNIHFRGRATVTGIFIMGRDFEEMKKKNFWRIVPSSRLEEWNKSKDNGLSRLFNGSEFSKLTEAS